MKQESLDHSGGAEFSKASTGRRKQHAHTSELSRGNTSWRPGRNLAFPYTSLNEILGESTHKPRTAVFGQSWTWTINQGENTRTELELFPNDKVVIIHESDDLGFPINRGYFFRGLVIDQSGETSSVVIDAGTDDEPKVFQFYPGGYEVWINNPPQNSLSRQNPLAPASENTPPVRAISVNQAAAIIGCTRAYIHHLIRDGKLPADKVGNIFVIDEGSVRRYAAIREQRRGSRPESSS